MRAALLCLLLMIVLLTGCQKRNADFTDLSQLNDSSVSIAMWSGAPMEAVTRAYFPKAKLVYAVDSMPLMLESLREDKVDAVLTSRVFYDSFPNKSGLRILGEELDDSEYGFYFAQTARGRKLCDEMNEFVVQAEESGLREALEALWLGENAVGRKIGAGSDDPDAPEIVFAIEYETAPFGYVDGDSYAGFDVDYAECFCSANGYRFRVVGMPYSMIAAGDVTGEYDIAGGGMLLDDALREVKTVSDAHYHTPFVVVVRDRESGAASAFSLKDSLRRTFVEDDRWKLYLNGLLTTILITVVSAVFGTALGFVIYLIGLNAGRAFRSVVSLIFAVLHITPTVVLLMIFYHIFFHSVNISGLAVSMILFTLLMTGTVFELMTASVNTIDRGQREGAIALGCTPSQAFFKVVLPQALQHFFPLYKGELVNLILATSIVGYIAVQDLSKVSDIIRSRTFDAFVPLFSAAAVYILLALLMIRLADLLLRKTDPRNRSRKRIMAGMEDGKGGEE